MIRVIIALFYTISIDFVPGGLKIYSKNPHIKALCQSQGLRYLEVSDGNTVGFHCGTARQAWRGMGRCDGGVGQ